MEIDWLRWAKRIQAIAQTGLAYTRDPFDIERYKELRSLATEMAAANLAQPPQQIAQIFANESGYATPKVDIRAVAFQDGRLLLVRERTDTLWTIPGGWADIGESPGEAAVREMLEEAGHVVRPAKVLAILDRGRHGHPPSLFDTYKIFIRCVVISGEFRSSTEIDAGGFFDRREIPPLSLERVTPEEIALVFSHYDDPGRPADFD